MATASSRVLFRKAMGACMLEVNKAPLFGSSFNASKRKANRLIFMGVLLHGVAKQMVPFCTGAAA